MPESFGRYRLLEQLGEGGMASVWRAVIDGPEGFSRTVVVKRILPILSKDARFVQMFLAEARLCALLHHPAIVQVNDLGEVGGEYFLAMEYVDGADLASVIKHANEKGKKLSPGLCCHILLALAEGLAYAHALRDAEGRALDIVHRDISPSNIMLTNVGGVKLLDFGIAKAARHVRDEQTRTGTLKGKISYMSPEQADGQKIDRRSDLFALGVVFWECLTGERLFRGEDELETLRMVREAKVWPPSSVRPEIEPDIDAVALRLLAKSAELRYPTGDELAAALQPIVHRHHADAAGLRRFLAELEAGDAVRRHHHAHAGRALAKRWRDGEMIVRWTATATSHARDHQRNQKRQRLHVHPPGRGLEQSPRQRETRDLPSEVTAADTPARRRRDRAGYPPDGAALC